MTLIKDTTWRAHAKANGWLEWVRTDRDERAARHGCVFDLARAMRVKRFFEKALVHSKGEWAGKPFELLDWQWRNVIGPMFGWVNNDGVRLYQKAYVEVPKKNGKSTIGAGIGLYMLTADGEAGSEVYSAATKKDQASIVHDEAIRMVKASPLLSARLKINQSTKTIVDLTTNSKYAVLASDAGGSEGLNIHGLICDELHVWKGREFWESLKYGAAARRQPLRFVITTAGIYDRSTLGWQEHEHAQRVIDGKTEDPRLYACIYGATDADDVMAPETHAKANPSYGVTIRPDEMLEAARLATERKSELAPFLRYRLNIWSETADSFFDMDKWRACCSDVDEGELAESERPCFAGLDLASKRDVVAWVLLFPPTDDDRRWRLLPRFFVPRATARKRQQQDAALYETWAREGHMILTGDDDSDTVDHEEIASAVAADVQRFNIIEAAADPWQLEAIRQRILERLDDFDFVTVSQNYGSLSEPCKMLEALVVDGELAHGGHPVLEWMAGNVVIVEDGNGNIKPHRKKSREKIDGIAATLNALARAMVAENESSVYETRGVLTL